MSLKTLPKVAPIRYSPDQRNLQTSLDVAIRNINRLITDAQQLDKRLGETSSIAVQVQESINTTYPAPDAPTNLTVTGLFQSVILSWTAGVIEGFAYTEVWRADTDNRGEAIYRGSSRSTVFSDSTQDGKTYYYWIRHVNQNNVAGSWNATAGAKAVTKKITDDSVVSVAVEKIISGELTVGTWIKGGTFYGGQLRVGAGGIIRQDETGTNTGYSFVADSDGTVEVEGSITVVDGELRVTDAAVVSPYSGTPIAPLIKLTYIEEPWTSSGGTEYKDHKLIIEQDFDGILVGNKARIEFNQRITEATDGTISANDPNIEIDCVVFMESIRVSGSNSQSDKHGDMIRASVAGSAGNSALKGSVGSPDTGRYAVLGNAAYAGNWSFYATGAGSNYGPFTGAHDGLIDIASPAQAGDIVEDAGQWWSTSESQVILSVNLCSTKKSIAARGMLLSKSTMPTVKKDGESPIAGLDPENLVALSESYDYCQFNSLGEGLLSVCGRGGDILSGQLLYTSDMNGKAERQNDELGSYDGTNRDYTIARSRIDVTFSSPDEVKQIPVIYLFG